MRRCVRRGRRDTIHYLSVAPERDDHPNLRLGWSSPSGSTPRPFIESLLQIGVARSYGTSHVVFVCWRTEKTTLSH